jgi:hypothetical protein
MNAPCAFNAINARGDLAGHKAFSGDTNVLLGFGARSFDCGSSGAWRTDHRLWLASAQDDGTGNLYANFY